MCSYGNISNKWARLRLFLWTRVKRLTSHITRSPESVPDLLDLFISTLGWWLRYPHSQSLYAMAALTGLKTLSFICLEMSKNLEILAFWSTFPGEWSEKLKVKGLVGVYVQNWEHLVLKFKFLILIKWSVPKREEYMW